MNYVVVVDFSEVSILVIPSLSRNLCVKNKDSSSQAPQNDKTVTEHNLSLMQLNILIIILGDIFKKIYGSILLMDNIIITFKIALRFLNLGN